MPRPHQLHKIISIVILLKTNLFPWNFGTAIPGNTEFEKWRAIPASVGGVSGVLTWVACYHYCYCYY